MPNSCQKGKVTVRLNEGDFPFIVQIAVPYGGFVCVLDAINAWHRYSRNPQYREQPRHIGELEFRSWRFEDLEIATAFRHRFGGEILSETIVTCTNRRPDLASRVPTAGDPAYGTAVQVTKDKRRRLSARPE